MAIGRTAHNYRSAVRDKDSSTHVEIEEITSGKAIFQHGLTTTCKDPPY